VPVAETTKPVLATALRGFFKAHPAAIDQQARGDVVPPTVANHR